MPNWCNNEVNISGETEEVQRFKEFVRDKDLDRIADDGNPFSFNSILPMPKELKGTRSPATIVTQEEYDSWVDDTNLGVGKPITQEMSDRFNKEYGYANWYDWQIENWGTKWDASEAVLDEWDEDSLFYTFDTAWSPPEGIYNELTKLFPNLSISWFYREDGMQTAGWL
jgi:hypothetical protein